MEKSFINAIVMATMLEAKPFVERMELRQVYDRPFRVYEGKDTVLILSGIGKANAAMASAFCCITFKPSRLFNLGAAGGTGPSFAAGEIFQINRIIEYDRPDFKSGAPVVHVPAKLDGFQTAALATSDRAVLDPDLRKEILTFAELVDMEGASVAQACRKFNTLCYMFKFVSDTPDHTSSNDIVGNIKKHRDSFCRFILDAVLNIRAGQ